MLVGIQVYAKLHHLEGPNYKLSPLFKGPFRVSKVLPHNKFELIHESTLEKCIKHWNEIKYTTSDPWSISELEKDDEATPQSTVHDNNNSNRYFFRDRCTQRCDNASQR